MRLPSNYLGPAIAVIACWVVYGCHPQPGGGSYWFPQAVVGVTLQDEEQASRAKQLISRIAQQHGLREERNSPQPWQPEKLQTELVRTPRTEYSPSALRPQHGFDMVLVEISNECWVVQFHDRTGNWTSRTIQAIQAFHGVLKESLGNAHVLVAPVPEQNWEHRERSGTLVDPQQPAHIEDFCLRMGVPLDVPRNAN